MMRRFAVTLCRIAPVLPLAFASGCTSLLGDFTTGPGSDDAGSVVDSSMPIEATVLVETGAETATSSGDASANDATIPDGSALDVGAGDVATDAPTIIEAGPCAGYAVPTITAGGPTTICTSSMVTLTASAADSYAWSDGETTQSITVSAAGSYTVAATYSATCTIGSQPTVVTVDTPVTTITAAGATSFCSGGSVTLTSSAASSYAWSDGETTQSITASTSGSYSVTTTDANGCTSSSAATTVDVDAPGAPTISGPTTYCAASASSVTLTSSSASSYAWSNGATTQSITAGAGSYSVTATDSSGCSATSTTTTVTSDSPTTPTITPSGPTTFCSGGTVTLTSSLASAYHWSNGATTRSISVGLTSSYTVTTTDASGCTATSATTSVDVLAIPSGSETFSYTGAAQSFTVPQCISSLTIDMAGAAGGASTAGGGVGGAGGRMQATYSVAAGTALEVFVGGMGKTVSSSATPNVGGYNGGAACIDVSYDYSVGTGGGASDIRVSPYALANRVIVAGAGGGAGYNYGSAPNDNGGAGGGLTGGVGPESLGEGGGGTQTGGGANASYSTSYGTATGGGTLGLGATSNCTGDSGGGGGGGYYGGGGGCWEGGGGGSSYSGSAVSVTADTQGYETGNGYVTITW